jgi:hypothetical protein
MKRFSPLFAYLVWGAILCVSIAIQSHDDHANQMRVDPAMACVASSSDAGA